MITTRAGRCAGIAWMIAAAPLTTADVIELGGDRAEAAVAAVANDARERIREGIQITELGCMRVVLAFDELSAARETRVQEILSDHDFRVFPAGTSITADTFDVPAARREMDRRQADLLCHVRAELRPGEALGDFVKYEAEVSTRWFSVLSGELLASHTATVEGERNRNDARARRTALDKGIDEAVEGSIRKILESSHRVIVHEAQFHGVPDEVVLLGIMEYTQRLKGVHHVRKLWFDAETGNAAIEIIAAPRTQTFWAAYIDGMPRPGKPQAIETVVVRNDAPVEQRNAARGPNKATVVRHTKLREKYPDWFDD